jgi:uncharacterized cupin superfamily protein
MGKYSLHRRPLSHAACSAKDTGTWGGGHPFEVEMSRLEPGKINFPMHEHSAQWEACLIVSGTGKIRTTESKNAIAAGDYFVFPPGEAHQLINTG